MLIPNKIVKKTTWIIVLVALCISIIDGRSENSVKQDGVLTVQYFDRKGKIISFLSSSNTFSAIVNNDGRWTLEIRPLPAPDSIMFGKEDVNYLSFDGSDAFYCRYSEAIFGITNGRPQIIGTESISNLEHQAYISHGDYPFFTADEQRRGQVLWLVFGSGNYIKELKINTMPLPWLPARWNLLAYGFRTESELSSNAPFLPKSIKFIRDSSLDLNGDIEEQNRPELDKSADAAWAESFRNQLQQRKEKWHQGSLAGLMETDYFTNVNDMSLPLSFTAKTFFPDGKINRLYVGKITNTSSVNFTNTFRPAVTARLWVEDSRFRFRDASRQVDHIGYHLKENENWLSTNSEQFQGLSYYYLKNPEVSSKNYFHLNEIIRNVVRYALLGTFLAGPIALLLYYRKTRLANKQQTTTKNKTNI